jgi:hypothetical protein
MPGNNFSCQEGCSRGGPNMQAKKYGVIFYMNRHEIDRTKTIMDGKSNGCRGERGLLLWKVG